MPDSNSTISSNKVKTCVASYIWDSPCLKPIIYNPFIVSALILFIIWGIDLLYGKQFRTKYTRSKRSKKRRKQNNAAIMIQHLLTSYILVTSGIALNNMLIKHRYRLDKCEAKQARQESYDEPIGSAYISEYVEEV